MAASTEEDEEDDLPTTQTNIVEGMEDPVVNHSMNGSNELQYETVDVVANQCSKKRKRWPKGVKPPESRQPQDIGAIEKAMRNAQNRATTCIFEPVLGMVFDSRAEAYQFFNLLFMGGWVRYPLWFKLKESSKQIPNNAGASL